ncbi:MurR/RpiR family transcriptional regulator [Loigolactobacillus coryniformis]|jgi:DNA-binding MurR/RpiR family transcriptional regulator|uniref:Transcription regulator n=3 Tax=Loigolactobacillus coryniformis TaxID=1610 RepID=J3JB77_9LACO|nr:MurR/RpiR family transcriptional regulator [Loigolactobacillus coryniformis]MDT3391431.1 MurR/RpiR family transcriptional regulator [Bacillota bacterium]RRG06155.1 MAG: MurR/RpiR family transcriptional regulator [Lactobacillus sp.]ATO54267.1 RpiR family transcriptional regulator [Loigolactobacillus coryniformis subsp. coryniformis KCTC 3167 = DSM 20001]EJN55484.1 Transcription regulator [Loigolactobacillus coryniformis subsp. coryniformis CECT 5711]KRK18987.1 transcription regulator [Loigol
MQNILFEIHSQLSKLSPSESKVAAYILKHPRSVIEMNTATFAQKAGVSTATIIRFSKNICPEGGFPALKLRLSAETEIDERLYSEINPGDSLAVVKNKFAMRVSHTITQTNQVLSEASVQTAVQQLTAAATIFVYGLGASNVVAQDFQQKFIRVGKSVVQSLDTHLLAAGLTAQTQPTVLVLISNSGQKKDSQNLAKLARDQQVPVIVLTHAAKSKLAKLATTLLLHDDSEENMNTRSAATTSLLAQLYAVDLLYYAYVASNYHASILPIVNSHDVIGKYFD